MTLDVNLLLQAAQQVAGSQQYPKGALYLVPTPIGNLADLSLRSVHVLSLADAVACEDTRVSGGLLRHIGLDKPLLALHQHNEQAAAAQIVQRLADGQRVAYVSDAGTPASHSLKSGRNDGRDFTRAYHAFAASSSLHGTSPR